MPTRWRRSTEITIAPRSSMPSPCAGTRALAEDLVSDAFEAALLTLDDSHPSVRYWLLRVCRHLWLDELRRRKRRPTVPAEGLDLPVPEAALEGLLREERYAALYRALRKLPDQPRSF